MTESGLTEGFWSVPVYIDNTSTLHVTGNRMFGVLGPRCWTGPSMLDCHVLKGFGIYMIGILGRLY